MIDNSLKWIWRNCWSFQLSSSLFIIQLPFFYLEWSIYSKEIVHASYYHGFKLGFWINSDVKECDFIYYFRFKFIADRLGMADQLRSL